MKTGSTNSLRRSLERLGLTPLEAAVYEFLTREPASTGYRIAQALGKSVGMIYKAVEALEEKGAAMAADDGDSRVLRAVPVADFLGRVRRGFDEACAAAERAVTDAPDQVPDDRLYRLASREQAIQRAIAMLGDATRFAIVNATPDPAGELLGAMREATERGVRVAHKAFAPTAGAELALGSAGEGSAGVRGIDVRLDPRGAGAVRTAPGEWLLATVDGRDLLAALFEHETGRLHAGYWTQNPLLAWAMFSGLSSDVAMADVRGALAAGATAEEIRTRLKALEAYNAPDSAGKLTLLDVYRRPSPARSRRKA
jgi:biotin operon repressor